jgi:hypothetical protein
MKQFCCGHKTLSQGLFLTQLSSNLGQQFYTSCDGFSGLVVRMLASGSQVRGFKLGRSRWIFLYIKILSMPSFRGEFK